MTNQRFTLGNDFSHAICGLTLGFWCAVMWQSITIKYASVDNAGVYVFHGIELFKAVNWGLLAPIIGVMIGVILGQFHPLSILRKTIVIILVALFLIVAMSVFFLTSAPKYRIGRDAQMVSRDSFGKATPMNQ